MREPLSPRRRKIAAIAGGTAAFAGSLSVLHHSHASDVRYSIFGGIFGFVFAGAVLLAARKRRTCNDSSFRNN